MDVYDNQYTFRMHDVHRLDLGATYTKQRKHARYTLTFGLYNTYNRKNPFSTIINIAPERNAAS